MPRMNGIEVARELKSRGKKTRIVFLTVYEDADILASCLDAGGLGYVVKNVHGRRLDPGFERSARGSRLCLPLLIPAQHAWAYAILNRRAFLGCLGFPHEEL